jgi:hypothetical protein
MTSAIFLLVHMAGGGDEKYKRFDSVEKVGLSSSGGGGGRFNRLKNLEGGAGFGETTFSLSPSSDMLGSIGPTSEAIAHTTPKVPAPSPADATSDGNAEDWVIVPTQSGVFGSDTGTATDGSPTNLKWKFPPGYPTPDPIHLKATAEQTGEVSQPTTILWNYPPGVPTPDPALLIEVAPERVGTPTTIKWNLGQGVPTPDPALHPDNGTPTTLKWSLTNDVPSPASWNYPPGVSC